MLQSTLSAYGSEVQNTFPDLEESNILCPYMSDSIKEISKACHAFEAKESAPSVAGQLGHTGNQLLNEYDREFTFSKRTC
ncbi:hypothetical protein K7X08_027642 [Anisodus acutangulus]|uniref:Exocyst complex component SEC5 n=1 Tax=Anisodus acutangulus TaxID=402998 RepID=A0A9Q1MPR2_9SOLA|nr:hypothetical protein K7X08_027642 [Anisodus acutangulus]